MTARQRCELVNNIKARPPPLTLRAVGEIWERVWASGQYCGDLLTYSNALGAGMMGAQASCVTGQAHYPHMPHIPMCKADCSEFMGCGLFR